MGLVQQYEIDNSKGKRRTISLLSSINRMIFVLYIKSWICCGMRSFQIMLMHTGKTKE